MRSREREQCVAQRPCAHAHHQHPLHAEPHEKERHEQHEDHLGHLTERLRRLNLGDAGVPQEDLGEVVVGTGRDAQQQLGDRPCYVFIAAALLLCIPLAVFYNFTQIFLWHVVISKIQATQSLGHMSEVIFMLLMPLFFVRLGVKRMLMVGMGAWTLRYALFALAAPHAIFWLIAIGILLHGVCYDFFFVTGQIYVDKKSTPAVRGQAQGFLVLVTYGIGKLIGAQVAGNVYNRILGGATSLTLDQWPSFWVLPAGFAAVVLVFFAVLFRPPAMAPGAGRAPGKAS